MQNVFGERALVHLSRRFLNACVQKYDSLLTLVLHVHHDSIFIVFTLFLRTNINYYLLELQKKLESDLRCASVVQPGIL